MMRKNNIGINAEIRYGSGAGYRGTNEGNGKGGTDTNYIGSLLARRGSGYGDGGDHNYGGLNGQGAGAGFENNRCTRLLTDDHPDISFYICQLHLMRGGG